ncbi:MAG TPA: amidohydrolase family protein, partial [Blastocatellia bacterium]|nr:amidohydrolase family protein [Blastocatellia bacterium]
LIDERGQVSMLIFEVTGEKDSRTLLTKYAQHQLCAFCSDAEDYGRGLPHPAAYGAFARILSRFVREDGSLTIEEAIRKMTSYPAKIFGLNNRGVIRAGAYADLVLLAPKQVIDRAEYNAPRRMPVGIKYSIVNGQIAYERDQWKNTESGVILRREA